MRLPGDELVPRRARARAAPRPHPHLSSRAIFTALPARGGRGAARRRPHTAAKLLYICIVRPAAAATAAPPAAARRALVGIMNATNCCLRSCYTRYGVAGDGGGRRMTGGAPRNGARHSRVGCVRPLSLFYSDASADGVEERSLVPRSRSHARLRRNASMSHAFSCVQPAFIESPGLGHGHFCLIHLPRAVQVPFVAPCPSGHLKPEIFSSGRRRRDNKTSFHSSGDPSFFLPERAVSNAQRLYRADARSGPFVNLRPPRAPRPPRHPRRDKRNCGLRDETEAMSIYAASVIRVTRAAGAPAHSYSGGEETICNCFHMNGDGNEVRGGRVFPPALDQPLSDMARAHAHCNAITTRNVHC
ncbi:hypothetical protein EVAR_66104_1 [Eumeta japonica]|uniref:Uncharacterized protein n=1 Tax=Eumeta variegata TaxID=151549 RepID=A0A4C2A9P6_EUMVA|nr:hypothetical protein EVAR_66104_1 [Eumeta japonica]